MSEAAPDYGNDFTPTGDDAVTNTAPAVDTKPPVEQQPPADPVESQDANPPPAAAPEADADDAPRDDKGKFIPKGRFNEAVGKERARAQALERELQEYKAREAERAVMFDEAEANKAVKELIKQHSSLLADGEIDKAADVMEKILQTRDDITSRRTQAVAERARSAATEEVKYGNVVSQLEAAYPQINPDAAEFDRAVVGKVQAFMTGLMQTQRMTAPEALKEAVETLLAPTKSGKAKDAENVGLRRKEEAVKKNMDAQRRQPASSSLAGQDHDKAGGAPDASAVMKMTFDEFSKLPDDVMAKMRGDYL